MDLTKLKPGDAQRIASEAVREANRLKYGLKGKPAGEYKIDGIFVRWDGKELVE